MFVENRSWNPTVNNFMRYRIQKHNTYELPLYKQHNILFKHGMGAYDIGITSMTHSSVILANLFKYT